MLKHHRDLPILAVVVAAAVGGYIFLVQPEKPPAPSTPPHPSSAKTAKPVQNAPGDTFHFDAVVAEFESFPIGREKRAEALGQSALKIAQDAKIDDALTWADTLSVPSERLRALEIIIATGASNDPVALARAIENLEIKVSLIGINSSHSAVSELTRKLLEIWPAEDAFDWVHRNLTGQAEHTNVNIMISELARTTPEAAARYIESMPNGPRRDQAYNTLVAGWAIKNGVQAMKFAESLTDGRIRKQALERTAFSWIHANKTELVTQLETFPEGESRDALLAVIAPHIVQDSPGEALEYANQIQGSARVDATRNLIRRWTEVDPMSAANHVSHIEDDGERARLAGTLLHAWLEREPQAAAAWISSYEGNSAPAVTKDFVAQWIHRDPAAASTWLGTLDPGPSRDAAVRVLIIHESSNNPEGALRWAETISDPGLRRENTIWLKKSIAGEQ